MPKIDDRKLSTLRAWVWSGFYDPEEVDELIDRLVEADADGAERKALCAAAGSAFTDKAAAERAWPETTDCDRLDHAFDELESAGVIALHNAGDTMSDGLSDVNGEYLDRGRPDRVTGYCFYHGQDLARAVAGDGLRIAFGGVQDDAPDAGAGRRAAVGRLVKDTLERHGLAVAWGGHADERLDVRIDWKRRGPGPD